jgi:hypothetical protein
VIDRYALREIDGVALPMPAAALRSIRLANG